MRVACSETVLQPRSCSGGSVRDTAIAIHNNITQRQMYIHMHTI